VTGRWKAIADGVLVAAALAAAGSVTYGTFRPPPSNRVDSPLRETARLLSVRDRGFEFSSRVDMIRARDTLLIFSDYQCPACKRFERVLADYLLMPRSALTIGFLHFPLPGHPQALMAATLAECARSPGQFSLAHRWLFAMQDSLRSVKAAAVPLSASVVDSAKFMRCSEQSDTSAAVASGIALARRLGVNATPTLIVNGWLAGVPADAYELAEWLRRTRRGKPPY